MGLNECLKDCA